MTKFTKITLLTLTSLILFTGCGAKESDKASSNTATVESKKESEATKTETVSFFADGEYEVGTDVNPGSYYVVLTDFQAENEYADVFFNYGKNIDVYDDNSDYEYESLKIIGKPYKITFKEDMKFQFASDDNISNWNVTFFTAEDYKEYQASEKK